MKTTYLLKIAFAGLICAAAVLSDTAFAADKPSAGGDARLTVGRSPKLGSGTGISIMVDGKKLASVRSGSNYSGSLTPGKHTLTVAFDPASGGDKPANLEINAVAGQTYGFIATIQHGDLVLTKNK